MSKSLIIAGGRDYRMTRSDVIQLNNICYDHSYVEILSGGAGGADLCGEVYAHSNLMAVTPFPADWAANGKAAGPIRNRQMAAYADGLAVFNGGRGTANMVLEAKKAGINIHDFRKQIA
jgi:hypothetical protein